MKYLFSLIVTILLTLSTVAFAATDSKEVVQPRANGLVTTSEISMPLSASIESTEAHAKEVDDTLVVRVVESPEIDTKLTFYAVIISAIAVLLSIISLFISIILQRKHNSDEVQPIVAIHLDRDKMSVKIKNHGVGPALFKKVIWKNVRSKVSANTLERLLSEEWSQLHFEPAFYIYTKPFRGASGLSDPDALAPQEELFFIEGDRPGHPMAQNEKRELAKTFRDIEVQLTYTDLYGKKEWTLTKNLSWLAKGT